MIIWRLKRGGGHYLLCAFARQFTAKISGKTRTREGLRFSAHVTHGTTRIWHPPVHPPVRIGPAGVYTTLLRQDSQASCWLCTTQGMYSITGACPIHRAVSRTSHYGVKIHLLTEGPSMPNRPFHPSSFRRNIHSGGSFATLTALAKLARLRLIPGRGIVPSSLCIPSFSFICSAPLATRRRTRLNHAPVRYLSSVADRSLSGAAVIKLSADPSRVHGLPRSLFVHPWVAVLAMAVPVIFAEPAFCRPPI